MWTIETLREKLAKLVGVAADIAELPSSAITSKEKFQKLAFLRDSFNKSVTSLRRITEVHGYEIILAEDDKNQATRHLNRVCDILERFFVAGVVSTEQQIVGMCYNLSHTGEGAVKISDGLGGELRGLIQVIETKKIMSAKRNQASFGPEQQYRDNFIELQLTLYLMLNLVLPSDRRS